MFVSSGAIKIKVGFGGCGIKPASKYFSNKINIEKRKLYKERKQLRRTQAVTNISRKFKYNCIAIKLYKQLIL